MSGIRFEHRRGAGAAILADRDAGRAVHDDDLARAAELLDQPFRPEPPPGLRVGIDLGRELVGGHQAVDVDHRNALLAGLLDHPVERRRRAGDHDDAVDIGIDHRLDLRDLRVGVAFGVGDHELVGQALVLELREDVLDRALGLLHPGRDRIDVGPSDGIGRFAVALDALGRGLGRLGCGELSRGEGDYNHAAERRRSTDLPVHDCPPVRSSRQLPPRHARHVRIGS